MTDFYVYINAVYKFGIWAVGIAALLMIAIGAYMYITSAGNNSSMEKAKGVITDAIVGLVLALGAYLLLYIINPDLVKISKLPVVSAPVTAPVTPGGVKGATCTDGKCSQVDPAIQNNASGIEPATLKSFIVAGEGCNKNTSSGGACGYSQVIASNRKTICGLVGTKEQTCAMLQNDIQLDINCGAQVIAEMIPRCSTDIIKLSSCYASGSSTKCGNAGDENYCNRVSSYYATCQK